MRPEVPGHADVRLVETEVHAAGRDEVDLAEFPGLDQIADHHDRRAVQEGVAGHQHDAGPIREVDQIEALGGGRGQRLLDEDVLAGLQCGRGQVVMRGHGRGDHHGVDAVIGDHLREVLRRADGGIAPFDRLERLGSQIADRDQLCVRDLVEVADEIRAPVAEPDDGKTSHAATVGRRWGIASEDRSCVEATLAIRSGEPRQNLDASGYPTPPRQYILPRLREPTRSDARHHTAIRVRGPNSRAAANPRPPGGVSGAPDA